MIFVTVGTQLPFDRLLGWVDDWLQTRSCEVIAQTGPSSFSSTRMRTLPFVQPTELESLMQRAELVVAHAGMGSVLTAQRLGKPIVLVPRIARLGEHRNEHQAATARWLEGKPGIYVAWDLQQLAALLDDRERLASPSSLSPYAPADFTQRLREWIVSTAGASDRRP